jgi:DNA polymerase/3'-5' exonuclease PolX
MKLKDARHIANNIASIISPLCNRIEIAGSIRREKEEVKDIELVVIPEFDFSSAQLPMAGIIDIRSTPVPLTDKKGWIDLIGEPLMNGSRYKKIKTKWNINLDLFIVLTSSKWGVQYVIRTGPASFSKKVVTQRYKGGLLPSDCVVKGGAVYRNEVLVPTPEEEDFFNLLEIDYIEPKRRR